MAEAATIASRRLTVLVVDDETTVREVLDISLRERGFDVVTAVGGAQAIDVCQRQGATLYAALVDKHMPGVHGLSTLASIRKLAPHVRCWLMTADDDEYTPDELAALGALGVIHKPFQLSEVARVLDA